MGRVRLLPQPFPLVRGSKVLLICTCDEQQPAKHPAPGTAIVTNQIQRLVISRQLDH
jgi:hypothetical protein